MISIIVPIFNIKKYLPKCIDSLIKQSYNNIEIILVDDGSTDGSSEICDKYAQMDQRIVVLHKRNEGLVRARKSGLKLARGEYIGYVDGDDWIEPDMYLSMIEKMKVYNTDVVMCGRYEDTGNISKEVYHRFKEGYYDKEKLIKEVYPRIIVGDDFFEWNMFPGVWDKLFKRDLLISFQMKVDDTLRMGEDAACTYPLMLQAQNCYIIHKCLYHYRQTIGSMVKQVQNYDVEKKQFQVLYQSVQKELESNAGVFDLREQWKRYVIFLMIPRSDGVYKNYSNLEYLFPFTKVKKNSSIVLYGAGTYGQRLYNYIKNTGFCEVESWIDMNWEELRKMQLDVNDPKSILNLTYDYVVIANTYFRSRKSMEKTLVSMGVDEEKICVIEEKILFSAETENAYGIIGG